MFKSKGVVQRPIDTERHVLDQRPLVTKLFTKSCFM